MKIDDIEVINLHCNYNDKQFSFYGGKNTGKITSIILVTTDIGIVGVGSAYSHPDLLRIIIENHLKPFLIGKDPTDVETLWQQMYNLTRWYGRKGIALTAIGGIDIALWDLKGKAADKPIYDLLKAGSRKVPAYASGLLWENNIDDLVSEATNYVRNGFRRIKMRLGRSWEYDVESLRAVRQAVGSHIGIMVDGSGRYSLHDAIRIAKIFEKENVLWFEEPFMPEDIDNYVKLRQEISVPVAAGENEFGMQGFRELLRIQAVDIVQPDASRTGGITESIRIGKMALKHNVQVAPHTWNDAIAIIANAHITAALDGIAVEIDCTGNPFVDELLEEPFCIEEDGCIQLSSSPGLGIKLNNDVLERYKIKSDQTVPNGNYFDMVFGKQYLDLAEPYK